MSSSLFIFFDLAAPGNREAVIQRIKSYGYWARIGNGAYVVVTSVLPAAVRDHIAGALTSNDRLFVGSAPPPSAWAGLPEEVAKWLVANQTQSVL